MSDQGTDQGLPADDDRDPIDEVAEDYALRLRRGELPIVDDYLRRYPQHADLLRDVLPAVEMLERAKLRRECSQEDNAPPPDRLGDFRIVREVGRGGMGIVYEAQQESLHRLVALKVLPNPVQNDASRRLRFEREACIAASLHHTNIVPIFGVGEDEGRPYIVMQYIEGSGLNEVIATLRERMYRESVGAIQPIASADRAMSDANSRAQGAVPAGAFVAPRGRAYWRFVARVGLQVADALAYAHERGAVHRDIKPSNLLLDAKGTTWLADFGIAKVEHQPELTQSGDLIGTTRYIAPEALAGAADARSDQYGLGVTLYEMATLEPAFGSTRTAELLDRIRAGAAPSARSRNQDIPRDLETIIEKAMSHDPTHRYVGASDFAEDLRRFLDDRPVRARRIGATERLVRWCRRNRVVAALSVTALASLVIAAVTGWTAYAQKRSALELESERLREVAIAEASARENFELSLAALEDIFDALAPDDNVIPLPMAGPRGERGRLVPAGSDGPGGPEGLGGPRNPEGPGGFDGPGNPRRTVAEGELLKSILAFYESFAALNETDTGLRREAARAYRRASEIQRRIGSSDALLTEQRALEQFAELVVEIPGDAELQRDFVEMAGRIGIEDAPLDAVDPVIQRIEEAVEVGRRLTQTPSADAVFRGSLSRAMIRLGGAYGSMGDTARHEVMLIEAVSVLEGTEEGAATVHGIAELGIARNALAIMRLDAGRAAEAEQLLRLAIDQLENLGVDHPRQLFVKADLLWTLAEARRVLGDDPGADAAASAALLQEKRVKIRAGGRRLPPPGKPRRDG